MELREITFKVKCDVPGCKNLARFYVGKSGAIFKNSLNFCEQCLNEFYESVSLVKKPASITSKYSNKSKKKEI